MVKGRIMDLQVAGLAMGRNGPTGHMNGWAAGMATAAGSATAQVRLWPQVGFGRRFGFGRILASATGFASAACLALATGLATTARLWAFRSKGKVDCVDRSARL
ncbi:Uncharacterized protein Rs2_28560 [Raphanus sativus]|nr:Uncharacterized protein Rs2_28560 [Raphanus sativus]